MLERQIAVLRGINLGRAKRVAMADLRALLGELGYRGVRTLRNSGNVVFDGEETENAAERIQKAVAARLGVSSRVVVLVASELAAVVRDNPLLDMAGNPSRLQVVFLYEPADRARLEPLLEQDWSPEALALGARVAYLWCPNGLSKSAVHPPSFVLRPAPQHSAAKNGLSLSASWSEKRSSASSRSSPVISAMRSRR
jgi:uncharacterized protein (DUF1697 family)